jgi:hypothetical protein
MCVCVHFAQGCQNLSQYLFLVKQTIGARCYCVTRWYLFLLLGGRLCTSSGNAVPVQHELQNGDPTKRLYVGRFGHCVPITLGTKDGTNKHPQTHVGRVSCRRDIQSEVRQYYLDFAEGGISVMDDDGSGPLST